jgi:hypothetical protein
MTNSRIFDRQAEMTLQQLLSRAPADPDTASGHGRFGINIDGCWIYSGGDIHG